METTSRVGHSARGSGLDGHCHTGGHCQDIREKGTLPGVQGRGNPLIWGYCQQVTDQGHIQNGGHCSIREEYRERGHSQTGDTDKRSEWAHIQSGGHCQGISGGTLSYRGILPQGQGWGDTAGLGDTARGREHDAVTVIQ